MWRICLLGLLLSVLVACGQEITNFPDPNEPKFTGEFAPEPEPFDGDLKVVSWNIKFGEKIETAVTELGDTPELKEADLLLLQEMDEEGVATIAEELGYNYAYYPASIHPEHGKNFGNAVLSKWPIISSQKIVLPHQNPTNGQIRIGVETIIDLDGQHVPVISTHTETVWLDEAKRLEQIDTLVEAIQSDYEVVLIGGDFNTATDATETAVAQRFAEIDLLPMTPTNATTIERAGLDFTADFLFGRGIELIESGVWSDTEASDHAPIWAKITIEPQR